MSFCCAECGSESSSSLVCRQCMRRLSTGKRKKYLKAWHRIVVERANSACEQCGHSAPFDSGELCGDHIQTQGSRRDLVFDVTNGRCVCLPCHNKRHTGEHSPKSAENRKRKVAKPPVCAVLGCPIYATGTGSRPKNCWKHQ